MPKPNLEWGEIEDRQRWVLVVALGYGFVFTMMPGTEIKIPIISELGAHSGQREENRSDCLTTV